MKVIVWLTMLMATATATAQPGEVTPEVAVALHRALARQMDLPPQLPVYPDALVLPSWGRSAQAPGQPHPEVAQAHDQAGQHAQDASRIWAAATAATENAACAVSEAGSSFTTAAGQSRAAAAKAKAKASNSANPGGHGKN